MNLVPGRIENWHRGLMYQGYVSLNVSKKRHHLIICWRFILPTNKIGDSHALTDRSMDHWIL